MSGTVTVQRFNAVYDRIICDPGIAQEISDHFTFMVPNAKHMPTFKRGLWDGKIRLFNGLTRLFYGGLRRRLAEWCHQNGYEMLVDSQITPERQFSAEDTKALFDSLDLPEWVQERDYQYMAVLKSIRKRRLLMLSPTNSGKTLITYVLSRYHEQKKQLLIVPDTGLVNQTGDDMVKYGYKPEQVHKIYSGQEKQTNANLTVSTWQSIHKLPRKWFDQYGVVFGDEAHTFKAASLKSIMEKCIYAEDRIAMTGSLDGSQTNELVIEGLFGPRHVTTTTRKMIDAGQSSDLTIKVMMLTHDTPTRKLLKGAEYKDEIDFLIGLKKRNEFIVNLALDKSVTGNTLITYRFVDKHGVPLYNMIRERVGDTRKVYLINKDVPGEDRIEIARIVNQESDAIIVASTRTFTTGIDLPNLTNLILSAPSKAQVQLLQSLGRTLRISTNGIPKTVYDIVDDMLYKTKAGTPHPNHTLRHFEERLKIYYQQEYNPKIYRIEI